MTEPTPPKRRAGAPKGNRNAWKHGRYSAEVLDLRRRVRAFCRRANAAAAAANRLARAKTDDEREKARAEVRAAVQGEGVPKNGRKLRNNYLAQDLRNSSETLPLPKSGPKSRNNYLSPAP